MIDLATEVDAAVLMGPQWPAWVTTGGLALLCLAGLYLAAVLLDVDGLVAPLRRLWPRTMRARMFTGIVCAAALPALGIALVLADRAAEERIVRTAQLLQRQAERGSEHATFFLRDFANELSAVAGTAPLGTGGDAVGNWLVEVHQTLAARPGDLLLVDPTANVIAMSRVVDGVPVGVSATDASLADQPYFFFPMTSPRPYVSDVISDPRINAQTRAVIGVPVAGDGGRPAGVLMGTITAAHLKSVARRMKIDRGVGMLIHDRHGAALFASGTIGIRPGAGSGAADGEVFAFADASVGSGDAQRFFAAGHALDAGWRVYVYQPVVELESALLWDYLVIGLGLALAIGLSMLLARKLAGDYAGPLLALDRAIREFDLNMTSKPPVLPDTSPREIRSIFKRLIEMENRMRTAYGKLRNAVHQGEKLRGELIYVIANREKEIKQRTEELKEANETLERLSREDSLTGLANRRWFAEFLARTWRRAVREKQPVSVLIIDIDNFKAYNDTYGHQKGDMCLKLVAEAIRRSVGRATDLVSRYGGEEFIVVLGDTPLDGALKIAEEIRATVEKLDIPHEGAEFHKVVTVSIGATSTLPSADMQPETFLVAADRAMYRAKNSGKNQVAYSTSSSTGVYQALCLPNNEEKRLS